MSTDSQNRLVIHGVPLFLTAFDPSDLPGSSIDPLGFERGYLFLADKILPGFTNVASRPRYFSALCAGAYLAEIDTSAPIQLQYRKRIESVLRFERFWALSNVLATEEEGEEELSTSGLRGISYVRRAAEALDGRRNELVSADYQLLSRQMPYGAVGIYGAVADGLRLIDRKFFTLTPDLGERLAEDFLSNSQFPSSLKKAVHEDGEVSKSTLVAWGKRAHISNPLFDVESECIGEAVNRNSIRSRMIRVLAEYPFIGEDDDEQLRFKRIRTALKDDEKNQDLFEAVETILVYEECYQFALLAFERMLWLCKTLPSAVINKTNVENDEVLKYVRSELPSKTRLFCDRLDNGTTDNFRQNLSRLDDVRRFLEQAASHGSPYDFVYEILERHKDIQQGKFDRGRRKMPWIERNSDRINLTMTRVGGLKTEATVPEDVGNHPYRLYSADNYIEAALQ